MGINRFKKQLLVVLFVALATVSWAQEVDNDYQSRAELTFAVEPVKNLKLSVTPMLRYNDWTDFDQYLIEGELSYAFLKYFGAGVAYRFIGNETKNNGMETSSRYAFILEAKRKINRFTPAVKLRYTNYADEDIDKTFLRYKASVKYNIAKSKLTPKVGVEAFHNLTNSNFYKMRYSVGFGYKLFKRNTVGMSYKLDYYLQDTRNKHIITLGYKLKF